MQYRVIPKTGEKLSILGFGCMRLPQKRGTPGDGRVDERRATRQIHQAIEAGVNYLDTAMPYHMGHSETFLGRALAGGWREKVNIATKLPPWSVQRARDMETLLNTQLRRLNTDRIDYYLLHGMQAASWHKLLRFDVLDFLERARADGRIRFAGFSFHDDRETFKEMVDAYDWELCQIQYNFLDRDNQAGLEGLRYAAGRRLGVVIMEPLRGGLLAGKIPAPVQALYDRAPDRRSAAEWSLRWIWNHPEVTVVLSGMNETAHIEENLRIAGSASANSMTPADLAVMDQVENTYRELMKAGCTGCRYCMPCPAGVDIPTCFEIYNNYHMFGDKKTAMVHYMARLMGLLNKGMANASLCEDCGRCVRHCPQHLPIPDLLKSVAATFERPQLKIMLWMGKRIFAFQRWWALRRHPHQ